MAKAKKQNYLHGAAILTAGVIIMKILGAIYKIPIGNLLGDDGYALFLSAYNVFSVFLMLATAGLPVALSRMISAANTQGRPMQVRRTFSVASWTFFALGALSTSIMFLFPNWLAADVLHNPDSALCIRVLAPSVLIVCFTSSYRGYAQGHENMIPTTIGEVLEVLFKVIVGLSLAWYLVKNGYSKSVVSAGAIFGVTVGSLVEFAFLFVYKKKNYKPEPVAEPDIPDARKDIFKTLISIGIPIALGSIVLSVINLLDSGLCMARLQNSAGLSYSGAKVLYGVYGKAQTIFNVPAAFITPLTVSVVPAIAAKIVLDDKNEAAKISEDSLRIAMVMALPMGTGLAVLSKPIMNVLYPNANEAGPALLCILGFAAIFVCLSLMTTAVLQASGKERYTARSIIAGGLVKISVNWFLVGIPALNIYGAPIGTLCCYITMCTMNLIYISRSFEKAPKLKNMFVRPALACLIMAAIAFAAYYTADYALNFSTRIETAAGMCAAIAAAIIVYVAAVIKLRAVTAEDMKLIPKGEKIAKLLHIT